MVMKDLFPTWKDKLIGAAVAVGLIVALALVAMLIKVTIPYSLIPVGFALWWIYYIAEVAINGGQTAGGDQVVGVRQNTGDGERAGRACRRYPG